jgi:hypothetical protein
MLQNKPTALIFEDKLILKFKRYKFVLGLNIKILSL